MESLEVRLAEYRDSLASVADQLEGLLEVLPSVDGDDTGSIRDAIRLHRIIAVDLTKLLDGEELTPFIVTGTIP